MGMDTGQSPEAVGVEDREAQPVLSIRANVRVAQLTEAQGENLQALWSFMERREVTPAGPPYVRYHTFGETQADLETGIPVAEAVAGEGRIAAGEASGRRRDQHLASRVARWPGRRVRGPGVLAASERTRGDGAAWEVYWWIDPSVEPDPAAWPAPTEWRTQLVQPIK
jgi:hypothetical protein